MDFFLPLFFFLTLGSLIYLVFFHEIDEFGEGEGHHPALEELPLWETPLFQKKILPGFLGVLLVFLGLGIGNQFYPHKTPFPLGGTNEKMNFNPETLSLKTGSQEGDPLNHPANNFVEQFNQGIGFFTSGDPESALNHFQNMERLNDLSGSPSEKALLDFSLTLSTLQVHQKLFFGGQQGKSLPYLRSALEKYPNTQLLPENFLKSLPPQESIAALLTKREEEIHFQSALSRNDSGYFTFVFEGQQQGDKSQKFMTLLTQAGNDLSRKLNFSPTTPIKVVLYNEKSFDRFVNAPHWVGAIFDGAIKIPVKGEVQFGKREKNVLYHELTHALLYQMGGDNIPVWVQEGVAQMMEPEMERVPYDLKTLKNQNQLISFSQLGGSSWLKWEDSVAKLAYQQSLSLCTFFTAKFGIEKILEGLKGLKGGVEFYSFLNSNLGYPLESLERDWRDSL